jgi:hypothetical protein
MLPSVPDAAPETSDMPNSVKFVVSDVAISEEKLEGWDTDCARARLCSCQNCNQLQDLEACAPYLAGDSDDWFGLRGHGFFAAAMYAFKRHLPLRISPDHIFQLVLEAWSRHVNDKAEALRDKFVGFQGKKRLEVSADYFVRGSAQNDWPRVFADFAEQIRRNTSPGLFETVHAAPFSTTGPVEQVARDISLMSATKAYFEFSLTTSCGFPYIRLMGSLDDWLLLREKVQGLGAFMLDELASWWLLAVDSILEQFVTVRRNPQKVDTLFWSSMNSAPVEWTYHNQKLQLDFRTGFVGALQDAETGELVPQLAWAVVYTCACKRPAQAVQSTSKVVDKVRQTATSIKSWILAQVNK